MVEIFGEFLDGEIFGEFGEKISYYVIFDFDVIESLKNSARILPRELRYQLLRQRSLSYVKRVFYSFFIDSTVFAFYFGVQV